MVDSVEILRMKRVDEFRFYQLANVIHPLLSLEAGKVKDVFRPIFPAMGWLDYLYDDSLVPLVVSRGACKRLRDLLQEVMPEDVDFEAEVNAVTVQRIGAATRDFETIFAAELQSLNTYFVSRYGIYSTSDLIEHAEMAFDEEIRTTVSDGVKKDFREAGRCLAFELSTACAYHVMRATEAVLRQWHTLVCRPASRSPEWAQCVNELRANGADQDALAVLDQIRSLHRNPIMHPEDFLSMSDAKTLFGIAISAITAMALQIRTVPAQPQAASIDSIKTGDS